jgi:hypothetical protein
VNDDIPDPQALRIQCTVNGEILQDSSTARMALVDIERVGALTNTVRARARTGGAV